MTSAAPRPAPQRRPARRKRPRYWLRRFMVLALILLPILAWQAWSYAKNTLLPLPAVGNAQRVAAGKPVYVVVMGVDERPDKDDPGRSDTLVLVRLSPKNNSLDVINIPRDTHVVIPSGKQYKINATYLIGGPEMVTETVSTLLGIPKPYYLKLNLQAFEKVVDKLDGVDINVDRHYVYDDPYQNLHIDIRPGQQHMDGATALKFVRVRYDGVTNDDIGRIKRQQQFMTALRDKLASPSSWVKVPEAIAATRQYITTDVPEQDQIRLAEQLFKARQNLHMERLPGTPNDTTGEWVLDQAAWSEVLKAWQQ